MNACIKRRLMSRSMQASHWTIVESIYICIKQLKSHSMLAAGIGPRWSLPMHALADNEVKQGRHWPIMNSSNAGIEPLWSLLMQALAHYEVNQCSHWSTVKSSNAGIGPLCKQLMQALALYEVIQRLHWTTMKALRSIVDIEFPLMSNC